MVGNSQLLMECILGREKEPAPHLRMLINCPFFYITLFQPQIGMINYTKL
jgi:hypothetical protein